MRKTIYFVSVFLLLQHWGFAMHTETIEYQQNGTTLRGYLVYDETVKTPRPAVMVAHAWKGQDEFARNKAKALAELGYIGFAIDIYGNGKEVKTNQEAIQLMKPLFLDRKLLQDRLKAGFETIKRQSMVDPKRIGGIGFCFGGLAILELFRSGVDLRGVVTFHAGFSNFMGDIKAKTVPIAKDIRGSLLILHGYNDPFVSPRDIQTLQQELSEQNIDWQMNIYSQTYHAFTDPDANDKAAGVLFNPRTNARTWRSMKNFFEEVFAEK